MSTPSVTESSSALEPAPYLRIEQIDVLRGVAVLGIYLVNMFIFALPYSESSLPGILNDENTTNTLVRLFSEVYWEGAMRGLFSILFGASALIFLTEAKLAARGTDLVDRYYRRSMLLIVFGAIHAYLLLWPYDVLYAYGVLGLFLFPLRKLAARTLLIIGVIMLFIGDFNLSELSFLPSLESTLNAADVADQFSDHEPEAQTDNQPLPPGVGPKKPSLQTAESQTKADASNDEYQKQLILQQELDIYRSGYKTIFVYQREMVIVQQSTKMYRDFFYDIGGMMLIGMALFRLGVLSGAVSRRVYWWMLIVGGISGTIVRGAISLRDVASVQAWVEPVLDTGFGYNLARLLIVIGWVGLVGLICQGGWLRRLQTWVANVGRMALTGYISQTVISVILFYGIGFALFAKFERHELLWFCLAMWVAQISFSTVWLKYYRHGPLEWVWRSLIYGYWQDNRRRPAL